MSWFEGCLVILSGLVAGALLALIVIFVRKLDRLLP
jgi:hypothetical protein